MRFGGWLVVLGVLTEPSTLYPGSHDLEPECMQDRRTHVQVTCIHERLALFGCNSCTYDPGSKPLILSTDCMQDKCEPPVYVSDRRFMKSINLLQVAAHADGRSQVCCLSGENLINMSISLHTSWH